MRVLEFDWCVHVIRGQSVNAGPTGNQKSRGEVEGLVEGDAKIKSDGIMFYSKQYRNKQVIKLD